MAALARSQNVCTSCRSRKKKCDGERPTCSSCLKRGEICLYAGAPSQGFASQFFQDWNAVPVPGAAAAAAAGAWALDASPTNPWLDTLDQPVYHSGPVSSPDSSRAQPGSPAMPPADVASGNNPHTSEDTLPGAQLPPLESLKELVDIYFEKYYQFLPILNKTRTLEKLQAPDLNKHALLFFSIICVTAQRHPNKEVQQSQQQWHAEAKAQFFKAVHDPTFPPDVVVAAAFISYQCLLVLDFQALWLVLANGWRRAVSMGYSIQDVGTGQVSAIRMGLKPLNCWLRREEARRAIWVLFIIDRTLCFPLGLTHAIDDRQLKIHLPMDEKHYQNSEEPPSGISILSTTNLDRFVTQLQERSRKDASNVLQFILVAYTLLGRVSETIHDLDSEYQEQKAQIDSFTAVLLRIRLILPRFAAELSAASYQDYSQVVWLNTVLSTVSILLHHKPLGDHESLDGPNDLATNWPHCIANSRSVVSLFRDATRTSTELIINPYIVSSVLICGRMLIIEYMLPSRINRLSPSGSDECATIDHDPALRTDLEVLLSACDRLREAFPGLGGKFRIGMVFYLLQDKSTLKHSKRAGVKDLLSTCDKWPYRNYENTQLLGLLPP